MPGGHPPKFETVEELQKLIDGYFSAWDGLDADDPQAKKAPNIFGLCLHCNMSYDCHCDYENGVHDARDPEFSQTIKKAKMRLLDWNAQRVLIHTAGVVFNTVNLSRKLAEPWKNAQTNEVSAPGGGPLQIQITPIQAQIT